MPQLYDAMVKSLDASLSGGQWDKEAFWQEFRRIWIYAPSPSTSSAIPVTGALFFLFWKNASVTNLPYVELNELIHRYTKRADGQNKCPILITTSRFYRQQIEDIFMSFTAGIKITTRSVHGRERRIQQISKSICDVHGSLIEHSIIVDLFFTSSVVYLPPTIEIDLPSMVANSGYIHSVGSSVYIRDLTKTDREDIIDNLSYNLEHGKRAFLTPYADEYFRPHERGAHSLRNGLDRIRLQARKHHIQNEPLEAALEKIGPQVPDVQIAHGLYSFKVERETAVIAGCAEEFTLWIVTDQSLYFDEEERLGYPGQKHYLIIYKQYLYNANPMMVFKERKPGWVQSITLPHTLSRAAISASGAPFGKGGNVRILDPFVGSGTTLIDAKLLWPNAHFVGLDADPASPRMIEDNIAFFAMPPTQLRSFAKSLRRICDFLNPKRKKKTDVSMREALREHGGHDSIGAIHKYLELLAPAGRLEARDPNHREVIGDETGEMPVESLISMSDKPLADRLLFYITWRSLKLNRYIYGKNGESSLGPILYEEFDRTLVEVDQLLSDRSCEHLENRGSFDIVKGLYSRAVTHSDYRFRRLYNDFKSSSGIDVRVVSDSVKHLQDLADSWKLNPSSAQPFDLIITDPPYGFNADESAHRDMRSLYSQLFRQCIRVLGPSGELIICLPASAKTGKAVPFYSTRRYVVSQILLEAEMQEKQFIWKIRSQLQKRTLVDPPLLLGWHCSGFS
ncbi:hypothetical protein [Mesorhizobium huakuii]|uniref:Ribosomal RNA large subunit methyltransferase K/L-like methyltransferase domain-containing protein n=1 Tax=Mesorhizobium huakuii TaxID=28104 RepID=A0A7G6T056_9HYPH|nr:hypothetical protein [Mesorhizobium huakuii]QND60138.1 hypothetical protein HB778_29030 [Mesorhizobium huakuii]